MDLTEIFLEVSPKDIAYIKFIFESYEGVGIVRTIDQKKSIIDILVVDDFQETARCIVLSLSHEVKMKEVPRPRGIGDDWLLRELANR